MRLPAERIRIIAEGVLRILVIALLAGYFVWIIRARTHGTSENAESDALHDALVRWTTTRTPARVHVDLAYPPAGDQRDWLAALNAAGTTVQWSGPELRPTALDIEPRVDPAGGADVTVAAPPNVHVILRDTAGLLDSARADAYGVRAFVARPRATIDAQVGPVRARAALRDSIMLKRLLVIGAAGWETKFTIAALEERGWTVDAHVIVSPQTIARQGRIEPVDTARYAAVLVIDTTASRFAPAITRYVRSGGGLIVWSPAARMFSSLVPGRPGALIENAAGVFNDSVPREALDLVPVTALATDAIVLERRGNHVTIAARRVGPGRIIQTGYTNSWRWRMSGGDDAPDDHRAWLAALVANVAYAPRTTLTPPPSDPAPLASLVDALGSATTQTFRAPLIDPMRLAPLIFAILCLALLVEWASRRLRGVR